MLNGEKNKKKILDITEGGYYFAVRKGGQNIARSCDGLNCEDCVFDEDEDCGCSFSRMKWLLSEYKEPIKLTKLEYDILKYISENTKYLYITRDRCNGLFLYGMEPTKDNGYWRGKCYVSMTPFNKLFQFVKWEDTEPTSIKEVLNNCEVIEDDL